MSPGRLVAVAALLAVGAPTPAGLVGWVAGLVVLVGERRVPARVRHVGLAVALLAASAVGLWLGGADQAVRTTLVALLLHQHFGDEEDAPRAALAVSTLLLVAAAAEDPGPIVGLAWLVWAVALPVALGPGGWRVRLPVALGVVALSVPLFLVWPRPSPDAPTTLAREVGPGDVEGARGGPSRVAVATFAPGMARRVPLRAAGLTRFDGRVWREPDTPLRQSWRGSGAAVRVQVTHRPMDGVVLVPGVVVAIEDEGRWFLDDAGSWRTRSPDAVSWEGRVVLDAPLGPTTLTREQRSALTALPRLDPRLSDLALRVTRGAEDDVARVTAITDVVAAHRWAPGAPAGDDPLVAFLLEDQPADCEVFASAVAVLARLSGVPARVATGFVGGEVDDDQVVWRLEGAHAWAEVHMDGVGWVPVDATAPAASPPSDPAGADPTSAAEPPPSPAARPPAGEGPAAEGSAVARSSWGAVAVWWRARVRGWDAEAQAAAWGALRGTGLVSWPVVVVVAALVGGALVLRRSLGLRRVRDPAADGWAVVVRALTAAGHAPPPGLTATEVARWLRTRVGDRAAPVEAAAWALSAVRYGGEPADDLDARVADAVAAFPAES